MGFFSRFSSCGPRGTEQPASLIRTNYADSDMADIQRAAAEDVALIESDNKPDNKQVPGSEPDQVRGGQPDRP